jgi:subtilase family serine protease
MLGAHRTGIWRLIGLFTLLVGSLVAVAAGRPGPVVRLTGPINDAQRIALPGYVHPAITRSVDLGAADAGLPVDHVIMLLGANDAQEADLAQFLRNVQTPGNPLYRHWMTPATFGQQFGVAPADLTAVRAWLQSKGFRLEPPSPARRSIIFSGTVGQLNEAFSTRMHHYQWHGERHLANSTNPTIPKALAAVVQGFASLHDFRLAPQLRRSDIAVQANLTNGAHALAPGDLATLYNLAALYSQGLNGSGRAIAVIGRSDVQNVDINNFRATFGLGAALPTVVLAGADPGLVTQDQTESDLDLEWAGGLAPAATLKFVTAQSTRTTDGVLLSAQYAVNNNLADVISVSYGACESPGDLSGGTTLINQLWQQAAAQGTSVFVSSGDSGAAGCDAPSSATATHGLGVNLLCSSPYSTCVGGTQFAADVAAPASYWSANNSSKFASALQYIGESVWNQSGTQSGGAGLWASGGGASIYYAKPVWQLTTGVPSDGRRDVPDVALTASAAHDPYLIYSSDGNTSSTLEAIGGTSAAAPSMAAIAALIAQKQSGRIGNINPVLYGLSNLQANGGAAVFHAVTSGNNSVPGQAGFGATGSNSVYNQATGLGSIDAGALLLHWSDFPGLPSGLSPTSVVVPSTSNVGSATLALPPTTAWSASIGGGGSGWLAVTPSSGTGSALLTYSTIANSTSSARTGTITIDGQVLTITQAAASGANSLLSLSSSALTFDSTTVGVATTQTLIVSNTGGTSLTVGQISFTGSAQADYSESGTCSAGLVLVSGASCFIRVSFDPTAIGSRSASLSIGSTTVALTGTGESHASDAPLPLWAYALPAGIMLMIGMRSASLRQP